jgi:diadenylate cyclase
MAKRRKRSKAVRSDAESAGIIEQVARAARADAVICGTETGELFRRLRECGSGLRLIAATPNGDTYQALVREGFDALRLSLRVANKYRQAQHSVCAALQAGKVAVGNLIVCAVGHDLCRGGGDLVLVTDVEADAAEVALSEMIKLTNGIRPSVMEAALRVACKIGVVARRGKRLGALFTVGDSDKVLEESRQMVLNPFLGHKDADRMLTNPKIHDMLIELAKLDGAFIIRGDGFIRTAAAYLATPEIDVDVPAGLGARHIAAAATTARSHATAIVVSATDGFVRAFSGGKLVLQMDPDVPFGPVVKERSE